MEFYDRNRPLTPRMAADELYRYALRLAELTQNSEELTLAKDAADLLSSSTDERLRAFTRRRLTNEEIDAYEAFMAAVTFSGATSLRSEDGRELTYRDYKGRSPYGEAS